MSDNQYQEFKEELDKINQKLDKVLTTHVTRIAMTERDIEYLGKTADRHELDIQDMKTRQTTNTANIGWIERISLWAAAGTGVLSGIASWLKNGGSP